VIVLLKCNRETRMYTGKKVVYVQTRWDTRTVLAVCIRDSSGVYAFELADWQALPICTEPDAPANAHAYVCRNHIDAKA